LTPWGSDFSRPSGPTGELHDQLEATGAVLAGRRTVQQVDHDWAGFAAARASAQVRAAAASRTASWAWSTAHAA